MSVRSIVRPWLAPAAAVSIAFAPGCGSRNEPPSPASATTAAEGGTAPASAAQGLPPAVAPGPPAPPRAPAPAPAAGTVLAPRNAIPGAVPVGVDPNKVVATVNGAPVRAEKVYSVYQMNRQMLQSRGQALTEQDQQALKATSLQMVVADELLHQAGVKAGIVVSAADLETAVKQVKSRLGSEENYKKFLATSNLTEAEVRTELERNLLTESYRKTLSVGKGVSDEQAKQFYDANKDMFKVPEQVHAQFILLKCTDKDPESVRIDAKKRAEEARAKAVAGEDFAALAKQYSQDGTAARGGDVGLFPRGVMFPKFEEAAFSLKPGEISAVFETPKGYNVLKVLERKPESIRTFEEVKSPLMLDMGRLMEQNLLQARISELGAAAKIVVLDDSFNPPVEKPAKP